MTPQSIGEFSPTEAPRASRILTVSNRGPVEFKRDDAGNVVAVPGQGGLATALQVTARLQPATWLSSPLTEVDRLIADGTAEPPADDGSSVFVATDPKAYELFYGSFSNEVLWFLQHEMPWHESITSEVIDSAWRDGYLPVNQAFADAVSSELDTGAFSAVMFHDYHFYAAPAMVRALKPGAYLQHFIHIPWPGPTAWQRLDGSIVAALCEGLLGNDSVVFQTEKDAQNFLLTCAEFLPDAAVDMEAGEVTLSGRTARVWADPISIDPEELAEVTEMAEYHRHRWLFRASPGQKTIVRVDRLDPAKNCLLGFEAYRLMLEKHPELREKVSFLALLVPSRGDMPSYQAYQEDTKAIVNQVNREFGNVRWRPIRVIFEHNRVQALAALSLSDVLLVNSLADGMNLVAKEGPILNDHNGVLILSTKTGAYAELADSVIGVDPEDVEATAEALYEALTMPLPLRRERAQQLKATIRSHNLRDWFERLTDDIEAHTPDSPREKTPTERLSLPRAASR